MQAKNNTEDIMFTFFAYSLEKIYIIMSQDVNTNLCISIMRINI